MLCFTLLYVVALCVKMHYVILCIKRLLIDWLIEHCIGNDKEASFTKTTYTKTTHSHVMHGGSLGPHEAVSKRRLDRFSRFWWEQTPVRELQVSAGVEN